MHFQQLFLFFCLIASIVCKQIEILPYNPVADAKAVVISGNARFTILTSRVIRLEYSKNGKFEDRATVAVLNRQLPVPQFSSLTMGGKLYISTQYLNLTYTIGQTFSSTTLQIVSNNAKSAFKSWYYGQPDTGNLLGTIKSLDELGVISLNCTENANVIVHDETLHCEWGLVSRNGWALIDDSQNWCLNQDDWWDSRNGDAVDLYFFGHGHEYRQALSDYIAIGGKIAMVPRHTVGVWWSIWYNLNNFDVMQIVEEYEKRDIPLDVYILDMDWHTKDGWGGYTFDYRLFPYPENTLGWLQSKGLIVGANLHDDDGVRTNEKMFVPMAKALGLDPKTCGTIPFSVVNASIAYALEDVVLKDSETLGMTFWWIDWQQGGTQGGAAGGKQNPTIWLNHLRCTDHVRRGENQRGVVLARWGGLGNHRYQVGFSGDVAALTWANMAFQPYFSMTGTNVGYGFWSHDIIGPSDDHELHTRWVQIGAFSGIFRTHDRGMAGGGCADTNPPSCAIVKLWELPNVYFEACRKALIERERLVPYMYTASRQAFDTGLSLIRPMYYDYPEFDLAYAADRFGKFPQYMFGDNILVSPIVTPANETTKLASATIWFPPGKWISMNTGTVYIGAPDGSTVFTNSYDLSEIPMFVQGGSIIPTIPVHGIGAASRQYHTLEFNIYPGATSGSTTVYEDDGITTEYLKNKYVWTTASYTRTPTTVKVTISSTGSYPSFPASRRYRILLVNHLPVLQGTVNGVSVKYSRFGGDNTWHYDGVGLTTIIETGLLNTNSPVTIVINTNSVDEKTFSGLKGMILKSILAKQNFDFARCGPGDHTVKGGNLSIVATTGEELSYLAGVDMDKFNQVLTSLPTYFQLAVQEVKAMTPAIPSALVQLWNDDRGDNCLCGTPECLDINNFYDIVRVEGYQPQKSTPGAIPLYDYWDDNTNDNYATPDPNTPNDYTPAIFSNGYIFASQKPGTAPLSLYFNGADMLSVATQEGINWAIQHNYKLVNATLGYVYTSPPSTDIVNPKRWAYSMGLLQNNGN